MSVVFLARATDLTRGYSAEYLARHPSRNVGFEWTGGVITVGITETVVAVAITHRHVRAIVERAAKERTPFRGLSPVCIAISNGVEIKFIGYKFYQACGVS